MTKQNNKEKNNMEIILEELGSRFKDYRKYTYQSEDEISILKAAQLAKHKPLKESNRFRQNYNFTLMQNSKESVENILERAISYINNNQIKDSFYNQYPFDAGQHIDLLRRTKQDFEIIELKQWDNDKDSPLYALIELLKYYFLLSKKEHLSFKKENQYLKQEQIREFTILAPLEYYKNFDFLNTFGELKKLSDNLTAYLNKKRNNHIKISFKYFNLDRNIFENIKNSLVDKEGNSLKNKEKIKTDWTLKENQEKLKEIESALLWQNWKTIF